MPKRNFNSNVDKRQKYDCVLMFNAQPRQQRHLYVHDL